VRSQGPNHKRKNHVKSQSVAYAIYHRSLAIISRRGGNFFGEFEINPMSPVSSACCTLAPELYGSEIRGL
jgi:hypothetical protein